MHVESPAVAMCYDRLTDDDVAETRLRDLLSSELRCSVRNGAVAGAIVLAILIFEGASLWVIAVSVLGAVALGALLHETVFLLGALVQRGRARLEANAADGRLESA